MKNPSKHIASTLFGMLLLLPLLVISFLQIGQRYIQSTREERLEKEELVQVILPVNKVVWEEEGKELWVGNRMFDVGSYSVIDEHYYLLGVYDEDETEVAGSLLHLLLSKNGDSFLHLLLLLQCFCITAIFFDTSFRLAWLQKIFSSFSCLLSFNPHLVLGPPPRR